MEEGEKTEKSPGRERERSRKKCELYQSKRTGKSGGRSVEKQERLQIVIDQPPRGEEETEYGKLGSTLWTLSKHPPGLRLRWIVRVYSVSEIPYAVQGDGDKKVLLVRPL